MEVLQNLAIGFDAALTPANLLYCFVGALLGTLVGVLPGLGPSATIALLLPLTFSFDATGSLIMLAGIVYGAQYGGSTTAILINLPGEASSAVTAIDGYRMAQQDRAGPALAIAALSSFFAGIVATIFIALFAMPLTEIALMFGPADYFSLMLLGLVLSVTLARGSILKSIGMVLFGLVLGLVGIDANTGEQRFTFGYIGLFDGLSFIALAIGIFGIVEILRNLEKDEQDVIMTRVGRLWPGREDLRRSVMPTLRGTLIGCALGLLPGGGATIGSFAAYSLEKAVSPNRRLMGHGAVEGVAAPESANNSGAQTSFIPMLTLGIPSNPIMALMIGALLIQGIRPGPNVAVQQPELFWGIIVSMLVGNAMLIVLNLPLVGMWVKLARLPYTLLFPSIVIFCCIGVFGAGNSAFDVVQITIFALGGYVLVRLGGEPAPLLMGFILGPMLEEHLRRAMVLSRGNVAVFVERPVSAVFIVLTLVALVIALRPAVSRARAQIPVADD